MNKIELNIEDLITKDVASKLLETISMEDRQRILEASLIKTLDSVLNSFQVERVIKADVEKYMAEYLQNVDVQKRIKLATIKNVDILMDGVVNAVVIGAQERLQNTYAKLVKQGEV